MNTTPRSAAAAFYFLGHIVNFGINFLATPYLSRNLTQQEFGMYGQTLMTLEIFSLLFNFGLVNSINLALTEPNKSRAATLFHTHWALFALCGSAGSMGIFVFSYFSGYFFGHNHIAFFLRSIAPALLLLYLIHALSRTLIFLGKSNEYTFAYVMGNIARVGIIFISLHFYKSLWGAIMSVMLGYLVQIGLSIRLIPAYFFKAKIQFQTFLPTLREGAWLALTLQLQYAHLYVTGLVISYFLGLEQYAIYRSSSFELPLVGSIYMVISAIMYSTLAQHIQTNNYEMVFAFKQRTIRQIAALIYPVVAFFVVFSDVFIPLYLSEKYVAGAPILAVLSLVVLSKVSDFSEVLTMEKNYTAILKINIACFAFFLLILMPLLYHYGIIGAAIAVTISQFFLNYLYIRQTISNTDWTFNRLLNFKHLGVLLSFNFIVALCCRGLFEVFESKQLLKFIIGGLVFCCISYIAALRFGWIDINLYENILNNNRLTRPLFRLARRFSSKKSAEA